MLGIAPPVINTPVISSNCRNKTTGKQSISSRNYGVLQHRNISVWRQMVGLLLSIYTTKYRLRRILRDEIITISEVV